MNYNTIKGLEFMNLSLKTLKKIVQKELNNRSTGDDLIVYDLIPHKAEGVWVFSVVTEKPEKPTEPEGDQKI